MKPSQLIVEIPEEAKGWPVEWLAQKIEGYKPINKGRVHVGDFVFIAEDVENGSEINDLSHVLAFNSDGTPSSYDDSKKYAVYNREGEFGDCVGNPVNDFYLVFRKV